MVSSVQCRRFESSYGQAIQVLFINLFRDKMDWYFAAQDAVQS